MKEYLTSLRTRRTPTVHSHSIRTQQMHTAVEHCRRTALTHAQTQTQLSVTGRGVYFLCAYIVHLYSSGCRGVCDINQYPAQVPTSCVRP